MVISHGEEENTNGAFSSRPQRRHMMDKDDTVRVGRSLDKPHKRGSTYGFKSNFGSKRHHHHQC